MSDPLDMRTIRDVTIKKIKEHRESPSLFAREALGMIPTPQQEELFSAIAKPGAHVAVRSGHGTGKSTALRCGSSAPMMMRRHRAQPRLATRWTISSGQRS
jgi:hypothetical protein